MLWVFEQLSSLDEEAQIYIKDNMNTLAVSVVCDSWMLAISLVDFFKKAVNSSDHWQMQSKPEGTGKQWKLAEFSI